VKTLQLLIILEESFDSVDFKDVFATLPSGSGAWTYPYGGGSSYRIGVISTSDNNLGSKLVCCNHLL